MPSKAPALIDWLVAAFGAAPALQAVQLGDVQGAAVFDGPPTTGLDAKLKLYVGLADPDNEGIEAAAAFTQKRDDLGRLTRTEQSDISCCAEAWSGTDDMAAVRVAAFAILAAAEAVIRSEPGPPAGFGGLGQAAPGLATGALLQNNTAQGAIARIPFTISFTSFT